MTVVALSPLRTADNAYCESFSGSLDGRLSLTAFDWIRLRRGEFAVALFHWPNTFFRPDRRRDTWRQLAELTYARLRHGTRLVWVVHNLQPHDGAERTSPFVRTCFLRLLSGTIHLSRHSVERTLEMYPELEGKPHLVTVHGRYDADVHVRPRAPRSGRARVLAFGHIRPYKNLEALIAAAIRASDAVQLTIAGRVWDENLGKQLKAQAHGAGHIALDFRSDPIPDDELNALIDASDAIVIPYAQGVLNSGVAFHALSRNRPVLAPRTGALPELSADVGSQWLSLFDGTIDEDDLRGFVQASQEATGAPDLDTYDWALIGPRIADFLTSLIGKRK